MPAQNYTQYPCSFVVLHLQDRIEFKVENQAKMFLRRYSGEMWTQKLSESKCLALALFDAFPGTRIRFVTEFANFTLFFSADLKIKNYIIFYGRSRSEFHRPLGALSRGAKEKMVLR